MHQDALVGIGAAEALVDVRARVDDGGGGGPDQGHADRARHAGGQPAAAGRGDVQNIFPRRGQNDDTVTGRRFEVRSSILGQAAVVDGGAGQHAGHASIVAEPTDLGTRADARRRVLLQQHHADRATDADRAPGERTGQFQDMRVVGGEDKDIAIRTDRRGGVDGRRCRVVDAQDIHHGTDADRGAGNAHADHDDVFLGARLDGDIVPRPDRRAGPDRGNGVVSDQIDPDRRRDGAGGADRDADSQGQMIEIAAGPDQHRLGAKIVLQHGVYLGIVTDGGFGRGADIGDPGRYRDADRAGAEGDGEGLDLVTTGSRDRKAFESALTARCGDPRAGQGLVIDRRGILVAFQVHVGQFRRADRALFGKRGTVA